MSHRLYVYLICWAHLNLADNSICNATGSNSSHLMQGYSNISRRTPHQNLHIAELLWSHVSSERWKSFERRR